jgi:hypothetical protein
LLNNVPLICVDLGDPLVNESRSNYDLASSSFAFDPAAINFFLTDPNFDILDPSPNSKESILR